MRTLRKREKIINLGEGTVPVYLVVKNIVFIAIWHSPRIKLSSASFRVLCG